ncbi:alpha/beta-hydrolase [Pholiota conissans]|uniref:Alpha/beta-hydrolase n=1 Tax=Pholiota conissans TaxID=109636 RepID=A0A9P6CQZ0_9AGAR|nr:alpha/beta-hydrolase [Pholiota conissans]
MGASTSKAPYGTWKSPITTEVITGAETHIEEIIVDRVTSDVYHIERRPTEEGRCVLVHTSSNRDVVGAGWNVITSVQEYGGAAGIIHDSVAYFSHSVDNRVYRVETGGEGGEPVAVTPADKPYRYACFEPYPLRSGLLLSVLEDHTIDIPSKVVTTLIVIDTINKEIFPLLSGADFYASPRVSPDGTKLAWLQWSHPDMPWEGGEVHVGDIVFGEDGVLSIANDVHVAGVPGKVAACYPLWANNDTLIFTSDESGFANPWKYSRGKATPLFAEPVPQDFGHTFWALHYSPYAILDKEGKTAVFSALKDGRDILYFVNLESTSEPQPIDTPFVVIENVHTSSLEKREFIFVGHKTNETASVVKCTLAPSQRFKLNISVLKSTHVANSSGATLPADIISEPQPITLTISPKDDPLYVVYYPPHNPKYSGSNVQGEKPPCIVNVHGGPTGYTTQALSWGKQYFTSRGWAWLDVNYGGSSGFGRKYIERLVGNWGIVDVEDCALAAKSLAAAPFNLVDPKRLIIRGGSAGGFTVLDTLSIAPDVKVFAAATSLFGVSDLQKMVEITHKFESQYLYRLLGGTPDEVPEVYRARSAVYHADKIVVPLLILQGEDDHVVPKAQAEAIYKSIKDRGGVAEYKLYPGEGHGWRQGTTIRDSYERELGFYERVLGLKGEI